MIQCQGAGRCFALRTLAFAMFVTSMACALLPTSSPGAGVTIITHGLNGDVDDWVISMANQMTTYYRFPGNYSTCYELYFTPSGSGYTLTWRRLGGIVPASTDSGEILIKLDWRQLANDSYSTYDIAPVVVSRLLQSNFISEMNGHALAELPIHLIGHSRGGSLVCEISKLLGQNGVWVDHLTTLDPHPLNNDIFDDRPFYFVVDAPARTYENVLFHDNYYQWLNITAYGEPVTGAYIRRLTDLDGGYDFSTAPAPSHADVHLWYHGTIDSRFPANDSVAWLTSAERQTWWTPYETYGNWGGYFAGFYYSLIGGGDRMSSDQPAGNGRVFDGYNQRWNLGVSGADNRSSLPSNNGSWPNLIRFNIVGTNAVAQGDVVALKYLFQNAQVATVTIFLDDDWNPYNGNLRQVAQYSESGNPVIPWSRSIGLETTTVTPRSYAVYARITAGGHSRYLYTPEVLTIRPLACSYTITPAERLHTGDAGNGSVTVTTRSDCDWTASSSCDWVRITTGASRTGNGSVSYSIDANPTNTARTCVLTIASQTFTVRQRAGFCTFIIAPTNVFHGPVAESGNVSITASSPADCGWAATADCDWVHINGTPSGNLSYSLDDNPNCIARSCRIFVAGQIVTVNQSAGSGTFSIAPSARSHGPRAAFSSVIVTAGVGCGWIATNNDDWISITAGASGTGNGSVNYAVQANSELTGRTGTVTVAGSTFTVTQAGIPPDTNRPLVSITAPLPNARFTNAQVILTGLASDDRGLARVEYQLGTNDVLVADGTNSWMAALELRTGTNTVRVWSRDLSGNVSTTNTRSFFYSQVPLAKGVYNGLFHETDGFRFGGSGFFKLAVTDKGTYSGSIVSGGKAYSVSGKFNPDGTATNAVMRSGTNVLIVTWLLDLAGLREVSGTVSGVNWQADLSGDRAEFSTKVNPARYAGKFTFTIAGQPGATTEPEGDGFGTAIVDGNGKVKVSGTLAEGTKFTQSATLSADGTWPLFASLYSSKGSAVGWMSFDPMQTNQFAGVLNWFKPPLPASKYYTNGLTITNSLVGSRYVAPVGTTNRILSITDGSVVLTGGNRLASITNAVVLGLKNRVTNASPNKLTLTFAVASGLFNGTFLEAGTVKKVAFKGAVLQSLNSGSGFFLGTNESGRIGFQSTP